MNETDFWNAGSFPHTAQAQSFISTIRNHADDKGNITQRGTCDHHYSTPISRAW